MPLRTLLFVKCRAGFGGDCKRRRLNFKCIEGTDQKLLTICIGAKVYRLNFVISTAGVLRKDESHLSPVVSLLPLVMPGDR